MADRVLFHPLSLLGMIFFRYTHTRGEATGDFLSAERALSSLEMCGARGLIYQRCVRDEYRLERIFDRDDQRDRTDSIHFPCIIAFEKKKKTHLPPTN